MSEHDAELVTLAELEAALLEEIVRELPEPERVAIVRKLRDKLHARGHSMAGVAAAFRIGGRKAHP